MCFTKGTITGKTSAPWPNYSGLRIRVTWYSFTYCQTIFNQCRSHTNNVKSALFAKNRQIKYGSKMENNRYSANLRFWLGDIIWVCIHAKVEDDLPKYISSN